MNLSIYPINKEDHTHLNENQLTTIIQLEEQKYTLQSKFLKQWLDTRIDALLMPITPWVGYKPKTWVRSRQWLGYTAMFNLLNYAAVTVPIGKADRELDAVGNGKSPEWEGHVVRNESDGFNYDQCEFLIFLLGFVDVFV